MSCFSVKNSHLAKTSAIEHINDHAGWNAEGKHRVEIGERHVAVEKAADDRTEGHAEIEADVVGAVGEAAFFFADEEDGGGLTDGAHDAVATSHESCGSKKHEVVLHQRQQQDGDESAQRAAGKKEHERLFIEKIGQREPQHQQDDGVEREKPTGVHGEIPRGDIADEKGLGRAVRNGKEHDDDGDRQHITRHKTAAAFGRCSAADDLSLVMHQLNGDDNGDGKHCGKHESSAVTEAAINGDAERRRDGHGEGVHGAVKAHAGADAFLRQKAGDPRRHADAAEGKSDAVDDAREHNDRRCGSNNIADASDDHQQGTNGRQAIFADLIGEIANEGTAAERNNVHHPANETHEHSTGTEAFGKTGDQWCDHHRAGHIEKAGS